MKTIILSQVVFGRLNMLQKNDCSVCHENKHSVSNFQGRPNMLNESKPQSKTPTLSFYQHFKTLPNKYNDLTPRYRSGSNSNHYRKFAQKSQYKSRSHSRPKSCSKYYHNHSSHNHSPNYDSNQSRYDQYYR